MRGFHERGLTARTPVTEAKWGIQRPKTTGWKCTGNVGGRSCVSPLSGLKVYRNTKYWGHFAQVVVVLATCWQARLSGKLLTPVHPFNTERVLLGHPPKLQCQLVAPLHQPLPVPTVPCHLSFSSSLFVLCITPDSAFKSWDNASHRVPPVSHPADYIKMQEGPSPGTESLPFTCACGPAKDYRACTCRPGLGNIHRPLGIFFFLIPLHLHHVCLRQGAVLFTNVIILLVFLGNHLILTGYTSCSGPCVLSMVTGQAFHSPIHHHPLTWPGLHTFGNIWFLLHQVSTTWGVQSSIA